jgi:hypothetical protein
MHLIFFITLVLGLVALALGIVGRFQRLSVAYQQKAEAYQRRIVFIFFMGSFEDLQLPPPGSKRNSWTMAMAAKYRWAARHPWLAVVPDPPEPE